MSTIEFFCFALLVGKRYVYFEVTVMEEYHCSV
jgi:hypothetical protein